jgi:hypothetical protein
MTADSQNLSVLSPWIPVAVQVLLGILTLAGSGVVVHQLKAKQDREEFLRGKLEALFEAIVNFHDLFAFTMTNWLFVIGRDITWEEAQARNEEETKGRPGHYGTAEMLISFYFPSLLPKFQKCRDAANKGTAVQQKLSRLVTTKQDVSVLLEPTITALTEFDEAVKNLKRAIVDKGENLRLLARDTDDK